MYGRNDNLRRIIQLGRLLLMTGGMFGSIKSYDVPSTDINAIDTWVHRLISGILRG